MQKIAVFPGSFDPFTKGHESLVYRALPLFDKLIVAIGYNVNKEGFFPLETRKQWLRSIFEHESKIQIEAYSGLTVDFCKRMNVNYIIRGLRNTADFDFEQSIAQMNNEMLPSVETIFLMTDLQLSAISSSIVRDIIRHGGDCIKFVPKVIADELRIKN